MFNKCPPDALPDEELKVAIVKQCEENNLEGTDHFLSKVQQLYDMMDLSDGVMLLGEKMISDGQPFCIFNNSIFVYKKTKKEHQSS